MARPAVRFTLAFIGAGVLLALPAPAAETSEVRALVQRARLWSARNRPELAHEALQRLARVAPGHPDGLAIRAELELRAGSADAARATLEQLRQADPQHPGIDRIETLLRLEGPDKDKLREARLLVKSGRTEQAVVALRALYPKGPPTGELALEYWQLVGSTSDGWAAAHDALTDLARDEPNNPRYRFALAAHELTRAPLNTRALRQVIELVRVPEFKLQAQGIWRRAVIWLDPGERTLPLLEEYIAFAPNDARAREQRDAVRAKLQERMRFATDPAIRAGRQGLELLERGDLDAAEPLLEQALAARANDAEIVGGLGLLRLRRGEHAQAQTHFSRALRLDPVRASKWRSLEQTARVWGTIRASSEALERGDAAAAEKLARDALSQVANHPEATLALARAQAHQGLQAEAEQSYRVALRLDPLNVNAFRGLIESLIERGDSVEFERVLLALSQAQRGAFAAAVDEARVTMLRAQAEHLVSSGRLDDAQRALERAVQLGPDNAWSRYSLALLHAERGAPERGRELLEELLERRPDDVDALHASALYLSRLDDPDAALAALARVARSARSDAMLALDRRLQVQSRRQRASALARSGEQAAAIALMVEADTVAQGDADALLGVARGWIDLDEGARASSVLDRVQANAPTVHLAALASLRSTLLRDAASRLIAEHRPAQAGVLLERALGYAPDDPWLRLELAQWYARQGEAGRGLTLLTSAADRSRGDAQTLHALALYQAQHADALGALHTLERIVPAARGGAPARTQRRLWLRWQVERAEAAARAGDQASARALLARAEAAIQGDAALVPAVVSAWIALGDTDRARLIAVEPGLQASPTERLRYAGLLARLGEYDRASTLMDEVAASPDLGRTDVEVMDELGDTLAIARADRLARNAQPAAALELLNRRAQQVRPRLSFAQAQMLRAEQRDAETLERTRARLKLDPGDDKPRWEAVNTVARNGETERTLAAVEQVPARSSVGVALAPVLRPEQHEAEALERYRAGLRLDPGDDSSRWDAFDKSSRIVFAQAKLLRAERRYAEALQRYQTGLQLDPSNDEARWEMIDTLSRDGQSERARAAIDQALTANRDDAHALRVLAAIEHSQGHRSAASQAIRRAAVSDWSARAGAGQIGELSRVLPAQGERTTAPGLIVARAPLSSAAGDIGRWALYRPTATWLDLENRWVSGALDWRYRSGSDGKSSLDMKELPIELRRPWPGGQLVARVDTVRLDAGTLDLADSSNSRNFGQVLLCQPGCTSDKQPQTASGMAVNVGYETETLRLDLGTTPLGFPLRRLVGGLRVKGDLGPLSYSLDLSSRPLTSSLLAYAGARDPRSGSLWGGVQANGATFTLSADQGGSLGAWALLGAHRLSGTNVQSNDRKQLMAGTYWRALNQENRQFSLGVTGVAQYFAHNVGEFSFGHGGYYSPRVHRSVSLPLTYAERAGRYSYLLRAAASSTHSQTDGAPFYPTEAALQASAVVMTLSSGVNPLYEGGPGGGRGYSAVAALEYQWRPNVQLGIRLESERSRDFEPNRALFYFRYALDGAIASSLAMPPRAVLPTSEF